MAALAADGFRQVVVPAGDLSSTPADGSTTQPFALEGTRGAAVTVMASDDDLAARFTSDPGDPVLAAHQLVAELAQLYYERPNGITPRAVLAVAPTAWDDDPAFVDALLGSLDGNPVVQAMTVAQVFALYPSPAPCRSGCRLTGGGGGSLPTAAIRAQRARIDGFATSAVGARPLALQLGDLVLGGEAQALRPAQQSAVVSNAGAALDAQLGQLSVEGDLTVTLTASSGTVPVTVVSDAAYPVTATLVLDSDKLLFPNGETQWSTPVTLLPRHSNVVYVRVRSRTSGTFRLDVGLRSPDGSLRLASGELSSGRRRRRWWGWCSRWEPSWCWPSGGSGRHAAVGPRPGPTSPGTSRPAGRAPEGTTVTTLRWGRCLRVARARRHERRGRHDRGGSRRRRGPTGAHPPAGPPDDSAPPRRGWPSAPRCHGSPASAG